MDNRDSDVDDSSDGNDDKESDGVVMTMVQNFTVTILDEEEDHKVVVEGGRGRGQRSWSHAPKESTIPWTSTGNIFQYVNNSNRTTYILL